MSKDRVFMQISKDMKLGILLFPDDVMNAGIVAEDNRHQDDEAMRKIPIQRCLPVDLRRAEARTFAKQNLQRTREALSMTDDRALAKKYLGVHPPYGMDEGEWQEWLDTKFAPPKLSPPKPRSPGLF